jgi:hypothetical protein
MGEIEAMNWPRASLGGCEVLAVAAADPVGGAVRVWSKLVIYLSKIRRRRVGRSWIECKCEVHVGGKIGRGDGPRGPAGGEPIGYGW